MLFFGFVVISDPYLFKEILNHCFKFSKNLMLLFIAKVTTEIQILVLVILNNALDVDVAAVYEMRQYESNASVLTSVLPIIFVLYSKDLLVVVFPLFTL